MGTSLSFPRVGIDGQSPGSGDGASARPSVKPVPMVAYFAAVAWTTVAAVARVLLDPLLEHEAALLIFVAGVVGAAWIGGLGPGLLATGKSALVSAYFFLPPDGFAIAKSHDAFAMLLFVAIGAVTSVLGEARLRALARADAGVRRTAAALTEREMALVGERAARARAEEHDRLKEEFLAAVSHELRTPLNAIIGWVSLIESSHGSELVSRGTQVIGRNARSLARILEDLLDVNTSLAGRLRLDARVVDLRAPVRSAIETVGVSARAAVIEVRAVEPHEPVWVLGDTTRLQQVAWNLLANAVKFTPPGGHVTVTVAATADEAKLIVADDGAGIAGAFLPHVFERFRQFDQSSTRTHSGLGLGLAIVHDLVEAHGGHVEARSAGKGRGATFMVSLPAAAGIEQRGDG